MARKDVLIYFKQVEDQYLEMLEDVKDYDKDHAHGEISDEKYDELMGLIDRVKDNYERIAYIVFLLNAPARDRKKAKYERQNKRVFHGLENSSLYKVLDENADALKNIKKILKERESNGQD